MLFSPKVPSPETILKVMIRLCGQGLPWMSLTCTRKGSGRVLLIWAPSPLAAVSWISCRGSPASTVPMKVMGEPVSWSGLPAKEEVTEMMLGTAEFVPIRYCTEARPPPLDLTEVALRTPLPCETAKATGWPDLVLP